LRGIFALLVLVNKVNNDILSMTQWSGPWTATLRARVLGRMTPRTMGTGVSVRDLRAPAGLGPALTTRWETAAVSRDFTHFIVLGYIFCTI